MTKYSGRKEFTIFMKDKPIREGFKTFILADAENLDVYNY